MSLKSFDKFCETLVTSEPNSQKVIFDERQNIVRSRLAIETLIIFGAACLVNCLIMDFVFRWAESYTPPMFIIMTLCMLYWIVRCAAKGCLIGISGKFSFKFVSVMAVIISGVNLIPRLFDIGKEDFFIKDGRAANDFLFALAMAIYMICGIVGIILVKREEKGDSE